MAIGVTTAIPKGFVKQSSTCRFLYPRELVQLEQRCEIHIGGVMFTPYKMYLL